MGVKRKISWTDATWNPTLGYKALLLPMKWRKPRRCFLNSMSDLFHESLPDEVIDRVFAVMALCPHITFQILTKRPERMREWALRPVVRIADQAFKILGRQPHFRYPLPNVWLGVSTENQQYADERIPLLLQTPAAVRFLSYEPALGPITFRWAKWEEFKRYPGAINNHLEGLWRLDWVIAGCESGPGARPAETDWFRKVRDECQEAGVPFFLKQMMIDGRKVEMPELDERAWTQMPR